MNENKTMELATLGGGCFWCLEAVYQELNGVQKVVSGYAGGEVDNPTYDEVCSGNTGHAEVVQITYDPKIITFKELLEVFFTIHNPTTINYHWETFACHENSVKPYTPLPDAPSTQPELPLAFKMMYINFFKK